MQPNKASKGWKQHRPKHRAHKYAKFLKEDEEDISSSEHIENQPNLVELPDKKAVEKSSLGLGKYRHSEKAIIY